MGIKIIADNRQAHFKYHLLEKWEAGLVLTGSEVKALRAGKVNLGDAYAVIHQGEITLLNCHIGAYPPAAMNNHEPLRTRKLLLHKHEIERLMSELHQGGLTLVPTKIYFKSGRVKMELALAKGKKLFDKRETIKQRETKRKISAMLKQKNR